MSRFFSILKDVWFIFLITVLLLGIVEGILRHTLPKPEDAYRISPGVGKFNGWEAEVFQDNPDTPGLRRGHKGTKTMRWKPYVHWRRAPYTNGYFNIDEQGLRQTWTAHLGEPLPLVFVMGGSTVWGSGVSDDDTLPSKLAQVLSQQGRDVRVLNFGESGWVFTQSLIALMRELQRGNVPDVVVFYDGINDVTAALQEHAAGTPQNESQRRLEFNMTHGSGVRMLVAILDELEGVRKLVHALNGAPAPDYPDTLPADIVSVYEANIRIAKALAKEWGFDVLFYWQPIVFTKRSLTEHESRAQGFILTAHRDLHLAANGEIATSTMLRETPEFRDISDILDDIKAPLYFDFCHLSPEGNAVIAETMMPDLMAVLNKRAGNPAETEGLLEALNPGD